MFPRIPLISSSSFFLPRSLFISSNIFSPLNFPLAARRFHRNFQSSPNISNWRRGRFFIPVAIISGSLFLLQSDFTESFPSFLKFFDGKFSNSSAATAPAPEPQIQENLKISPIIPPEPAVISSRYLSFNSMFWDQFLISCIETILFSPFNRPIRSIRLAISLLLRFSYYFACYFYSDGATIGQAIEGIETSRSDGSKLSTIRFAFLSFFQTIFSFYSFNESLEGLATGNLSTRHPLFCLNWINYLWVFVNFSGDYQYIPNYLTDSVLIHPIKPKRVKISVKEKVMKQLRLGATP